MLKWFRNIVRRRPPTPMERALKEIHTTTKQIDVKAKQIDTHLAAGEHFHRGWDLAHNGKYSEAVKEYDRALKLTPTDPRALTHKGIALAKLGKASQARRTLAAAEKHQQPSDRIAKHLARAYAVLGDKTRALQFLSEAVAGDRTEATFAGIDEEFVGLREDASFKRIVGKS